MGDVISFTGRMKAAGQESTDTTAFDELDEPTGEGEVSPLPPVAALPPARNREKHAWISGLLLPSGHASIVLLPSKCKPEGLPPQWRNAPVLTLEFSIGFTRDLEFDFVGIAQTLTFDTGKWYCNIPWEAVFAIGRPGPSKRIWLEDAPEMVMRDIKWDKPIGQA